MGIFIKLLEKLSKTHREIYTVDTTQIDDVNYESLRRRLYGHNMLYNNTPTSTSRPVERYYPSGMTSNYFAQWCGTTYNDEFRVPKIDPKPLLRFMKKLAPFVVDIEKIERHEDAMIYDPYTFSPIRSTVFRVFVVLEPTHFAEAHSNEKFKNLLSDTLKNRLSQLINCMYEGVHKDSIVFEYQPTKSEKLVEDIKKLYYI